MAAVDGRREPGTDPGDLEQLEHGVDRPPWGPGRWLAAIWARLPRGARGLGIALVGVVTGALAWQVLQSSTTKAPRPAPTSSWAVSSVLVAESVCTSYTGGILQVGFLLTNVGQRAAQIVVVRPDLPMGMLLEYGVDLTSTPCQSTSTRQGGAAVPVHGTLTAGASTPVTFRFIPLVDCPAPAPVGAVVEVGGDASPAVVSVPLLVDLGSVRFPGCNTVTS